MADTASQGLHESWILRCQVISLKYELRGGGANKRVKVEQPYLNDQIASFSAIEREVEYF
jgi:hypothetical protein